MNNYRPDYSKTFNAIVIIGIMLSAIAFGATWYSVSLSHGGLSYDSAEYVENALRWSGNLRAHEAPTNSSGRPPLLTIGLTIVALIPGGGTTTALAYAGTLVPYGLLMAVVLLTSRYLVKTYYSWVAMLLLSSAPGVFALAGTVLVETLLSAWILLALCLAASALEKTSLRKGLALGCVIGAALMTKLSAVTILVLPALYFVYRISIERAALSLKLKTLACCVSGVLAVAGPWYFRYWAVIFDHASFASKFDVYGVGMPDFGFRGFRVVDGFVFSFGVVVSLLLVILMVWYFSKRDGGRAEGREADTFVVLSFLAAMGHALALCIPSYYETRFFVPVAPTIAVMAACMLHKVVNELGFRPLIGFSGVVAICAVVTLFALVRTNQNAAKKYLKWDDAAGLLEDLAATYKVAYVANVGHDPSWNASKLNMFARTKASSRKMDVSEAARYAEDAMDHISRSHAVLVLQPGAIDQMFLKSAPAQNRGYSRTLTLMPPPNFSEVSFSHKKYRLPDIKIYIRNELINAPR